MTPELLNNPSSEERCDDRRYRSPVALSSNNSGTIDLLTAEGGVFGAMFPLGGLSGQAS